MRAHAVKAHAVPFATRIAAEVATIKRERAADAPLPTIGQFLYRRVLAGDQQQRNGMFSRHPALTATRTP